jgi:CRP/FNR family transcriptional regulator, cyclic AMP receptor protein
MNIFRPPLWYLQKIELFDTLSDAQMDSLMTSIEHCELPKKHIIYTPHTQDNKTYILKEGEVLLYQIAEEGSKKIIIDVLKPGTIFGNIGYEDGNSASTFAEVSEKSYVCILPPNFFILLITTYPTIAIKAFKLLQKRIMQYESQLKFLGVLNAKDRILVAIHLLNEKDAQSILPALLRRATNITHDKLASLTGLTRETVTKQLIQLQKEGCIISNKKQILVTEYGKNVVMNLT